MRRFWNQIFTWVSFRPRLWAISIRRALVRYLFVQNSFSNSVSCLVVKFVRPVLLVLLWKASCWSLLIRLVGGGSLWPSFITSWPPFWRGKSDCRATERGKSKSLALKVSKSTVSDWVRPNQPNEIFTRSIMCTRNCLHRLETPNTFGYSKYPKQELKFTQRNPLINGAGLFA